VSSLVSWKSRVGTMRWQLPAFYRGRSHAFTYLSKWTSCVSPLNFIVKGFAAGFIFQKNFLSLSPSLDDGIETPYVHFFTN
jgi:hypothetical protein